MPSSLTYEEGMSKIINNSVFWIAWTWRGAKICGWKQPFIFLSQQDGAMSCVSTNLETDWVAGRDNW